jgi:hypothetical protein
MKNETIIYQAGIEIKSDEKFEELSFTSFTIRKGRYAAIVVHEFKENPEEIKKAFDILIAHSDIDPKGYCLEVYDANTVKCMVPLIFIT